MVYNGLVVGWRPYSEDWYLVGTVLMVYNSLVVGWRPYSEDWYLVGTVLMVYNGLVVGWRPYSEDWYLVGTLLMGWPVLWDGTGLPGLIRNFQKMLKEEVRKKEV
jgi:hypothetical protein